MTSKDREAFEAWYVLRCKAKSPPPRHGDDYIHADPTLTWHGWQAARDHYAPKLTRDEAVQKAERAAYAAIYEPPMRKGFDDAHAAIRLQVNSMVRAALRAAGVEFRDEP